MARFLPCDTLGLGLFHQLLMFDVASGKDTKCYGKIHPFLIGKPSISMGYFP